MDDQHQPDSAFLVGVIESRRWGVAPHDRRRRATRWVRAAMVVQIVLLVLVLGLLVTGRPGLDAISRFVTVQSGYGAGHAMPQPADAGADPTDSPVAETHVEPRL